MCVTKREGQNLHGTPLRLREKNVRVWLNFSEESKSQGHTFPIKVSLCAILYDNFMLPAIYHENIGNHRAQTPGM